ncbi:hypothetical protein BDN72DRAFT_785411 [Pluteus cervinus]|uniref:Uncharacterized protein n=1 Tax=Pluteus cervinus TaxID=181527 RepID=A0ACD3BEK5_9AGAR|nr:hypothetical protein BDN72DRAFT_785411 [Pluteus cervinus]
METEAPPPIGHVLRPHHIDLLTIIILMFRDMASRKLPAEFSLYVYHLLLNEVSEIAQPKSHQEIAKALEDSPTPEVSDARDMVMSFKAVHVTLSTTEQMSLFFSSLPFLFTPPEPEEESRDGSILLRHSLLGYFCRRCHLSFLKLSFAGLAKLQKDYQAWCRDDLSAGYEAVYKDNLNSNDLFIFHTRGDKKSWAKPDAYEKWEHAQATGDAKVATENLRKFFEQHFHESNDSGVRQHALLNLVRMHYLQEEYDAARKLLGEAISVARTSGDRLTLQHCISMMHRLPPDNGSKPALNEIQPDLHPLEVLYDVCKLLDEENNQPLSAAFSKILQAVGLYDHWIDVQMAVPNEADQWAQHAVQSIVWSAAGCDRLTTVEESIVLAFTEHGGSDNSRLTVLMNRAYRMARQGSYDPAIAILLDPLTWRGLLFRDYISWAHSVWHTLALRATRRGQDRLYREFLLPHRPQGHFNPKEYEFNVKGRSLSKIRDPLHRVLELRQCDQAVSAVEQLLTALWHSEFLFRIPLYRTGILMLADIGLEFGLTKKCQRIVEEIMPQIISGNDLEQRATGCFILARCIIVAQDEDLNAVLPYLKQAEADFTTLQIYRSLMDVQYFISVVHNTLGMAKERDAAADRYSVTEKKMKALEMVAVDQEVEDILNVVAEIGAALAHR